MEDWELNALGVLAQEDLEVICQAMAAFITDNEIHVGETGYPTQSQLNRAWKVKEGIDAELQRRAAEYKDTPRNRM
jgi:hypothetical protein